MSDGIFDGTCCKNSSARHVIQKERVYHSVDGFNGGNKVIINLDDDNNIIRV